MNNQSIACDKQITHTYRYEFAPTLAHSNAYGNIYFARYFEWQGSLREKWFSECIVPDMFALKGALVTKFARNEYKQEVFPFQNIRCTLNTQAIKKASFLLIFRFYDRDSGALLSAGEQKIAFMENGKLKKLPDDIIQKVRAYELPSE